MELLARLALSLLCLSAASGCLVPPHSTAGAFDVGRGARSLATGEVRLSGGAGVAAAGGLNTRRAERGLEPLPPLGGAGLRLELQLHELLALGVEGGVGAPFLIGAGAALTSQLNLGLDMLALRFGAGGAIAVPGPIASAFGELVVSAPESITGPDFEPYARLRVGGGYVTSCRSGFGVASTTFGTSLRVKNAVWLFGAVSLGSSAQHGGRCGEGVVVLVEPNVQVGLAYRFPPLFSWESYSSSETAGSD